MRRLGRHRRPIVALAMTVTLAAPLVLPGPPVAAQGDLRPPTQPVSWLHLGDSYASGEGTSGATGDCQQSQQAFGPKTVSILGQERSWRSSTNILTACTGDLLADLFTSRATQRATDPSTPGRTATSPIADTQSQLDLIATQGLPADARFDVINLSIGGNDIGFAAAIEDCLTILPDEGDTWHDLVQGDRCDITEDELARRIDELTDENGPLETTYRRLVDERLVPDGLLVVAGYPRLLSPSDTWGRWRGGLCNSIVNDDADLLGRSAERLDERMRAVAERVDGGRGRIAYVSRLAIFDDDGNYHNLCGRTVEWINTVGLFLRDGTGRKDRGFHPNDLGHLATAESVAGTVERRLGVPPPTTTTSTTTTTTTKRSSTTSKSTTTTAKGPVVRSGDQHYDIGDEFSDRCTIAWPTAPSRGVDNIQMRTTCLKTPDQFLFVDIVYPDPDLPVTPSKARMRVHGRVADISRSEFGFTVLVVLADDIEIE